MNRTLGHGLYVQRGTTTIECVYIMGRYYDETGLVVLAYDIAREADGQVFKVPEWRVHKIVWI